MDIFSRFCGNLQNNYILEEFLAGVSTFLLIWPNDFHRTQTSKFFGSSYQSSFKNNFSKTNFYFGLCVSYTKFRIKELRST